MATSNTAKNQSELEGNTAKDLFETGGKETSDALLSALENSGIAVDKSAVNNLSKQVMDKLSEGLPKELFNLMQGIAENEDEEEEETEDEEKPDVEEETAATNDDKEQPRPPQDESANDDIENFGTEEENNETNAPTDTTKPAGEKRPEQVPTEDENEPKPESEKKPSEEGAKPEEKPEEEPNETEKPKDRFENGEDKAKQDRDKEKGEEKPQIENQPTEPNGETEGQKPEQKKPEEGEKNETEKPESEAQPQPDEPSAEAEDQDKKQGEGEEKPEGEPEPGQEQSQGEPNAEPQLGVPNTDEQKPTQTKAQKCPNCGADMNPDGSCNYCGKKADQGDANSEKGNTMQGLNYLMHRSKIKQLDQETEELNKKKKEIDDKLKKINDKIKPDEEKISKFTRSIVGLRAVMYILIFIGVLLAVTLIFLFLIPIAPPILSAAKSIDTLINGLKLKRKELEKKIEPEKKEKKGLEANLKKLNAQIRTKFIERRNMINQSAGQNIYQGVMGKK